MRKKPETIPLPAHRPRLDVDWELVDRMLEAGCSGVQIAGHYGMNDKGFYDKFKKEKGETFTEYSHRKRSSGEAKLVLKQFEQALGTCVKRINTPILLRLGEHRLGQGKAPESIPPNHDLNNKDVEIANLQNANNELKAKVDALLAQTSQVDNGSNPSI